MASLKRLLVTESPGDRYLAFLGRISPEKRPDRAISIAKRLGMRLKMAAKVDAVNGAYFRDKIEPLLDDPLIEFIGEIVTAKNRLSLEMPSRSCSRSIGPSRLVWC